MTQKQIDNRIEEMLISKIAHYRLSVRELFRKRHDVAWPTLIRKEISHDIRRLRTWLRMAELIDETQNNTLNKTVMPYTTYLAKQLS